MIMADEKVFLQDDNVFVSNSRVILSGVTYATSNITSVSTASTPPNRGCASLLLVAGVIVLLGSLAAFGSDAKSGLAGVLISAAILVGAVAWLKSLKPTFHLLLRSSSGEQKALSTSDEKLINRIVQAVSEAIVARG
jgi:hypothetical protein